MLVLAHDGVGFPMTKFYTVINIVRALGNETLSAKNASGIITTIPFPSAFGHDS